MPSPARVLLALALVASACRGARAEPPTPPTLTADPDGAKVDEELEAAVIDPAELEPPTRWVIEGTHVGAELRVPLAHARALRAHGRGLAEIQDRVLYDLNGDGRLDAVVLLPAPSVAGAYDALVLLSAGEQLRVHELGPLVDEAIFAVAVVPLVEGPTLVATAPRLGSCERGPSWSFLRPTGELLEGVGRLAIEPYDCAEAEGEIRFVREAEGRVTEVELRHGEDVEVQIWDPSLGAFTAAAR